MPGRRSAVTRSGGVETTVHQERRRIYPAYRPSHPRTRPGIRRFGRLGLSFAPGAPSWRNWQTRRSQKPLSERTCGFESHTRHQGRMIFSIPGHLSSSHVARRDSAVDRTPGPFSPPPRPDRDTRAVQTEVYVAAATNPTLPRRPHLIAVRGRIGCGFAVTDADVSAFRPRRDRDAPGAGVEQQSRSRRRSPVHGFRGQAQSRR